MVMDIYCTLLPLWLLSVSSYRKIILLRQLIYPALAIRSLIIQYDSEKMLEELG